MLRAKLALLAAVLLAGIVPAAAPFAQPAIGQTITAAGNTTAGKANVVDGLELTAPQKKERPGLAFVEAKLAVTVKDGDKVKIVWDVESQFEDPDVEFSWEIRDGKRVQLVIPDSNGVIKVSAVAIVNGEPTSNVLAKTLIDVYYTPRPPKGPPGPAPGPVLPIPGPGPAPTPAPAPVSGKVVDAYFVIDQEGGDPDVGQLATSATTRNKLRAAGIQAHVFDKDSAAVGRNGLAKFVTDAGGVPVVVLVTDKRAVRRVIKLDPTTTLETILKEAGAS